METTRASRPIPDAPAPGCPSHLAGIGAGQPGLQGATMSNSSQPPPSAVPSSPEPDFQEMTDAWWQSRHPGLIQKAARNQLGPPSRLIPRTLAAYRLGLISCSICLRTRSLWETPGDQSTWSGVLQAISQLDEARRALPPEITGWTYSELPFVFAKFNRLTANLNRAGQTTGQYNGARFGSGPVPGIEFWRELRSLADDAPDEGDRSRPYYELGVALRDFQLELWDLDQAAVMSNDLGLVDFRTINELTRTLDSRIQEGLLGTVRPAGASGPNTEV